MYAQAGALQPGSIFLRLEIHPHPQSTELLFFPNKSTELQHDVCVALATKQRTRKNYVLFVFKLIWCDDVYACSFNQTVLRTVLETRNAFGDEPCLRLSSGTNRNENNSPDNHMKVRSRKAETWNLHALTALSLSPILWEVKQQCQNVAGCCSAKIFGSARGRVSASFAFNRTPAVKVRSGHIS